jgi:hypothetical protein
MTSAITLDLNPMLIALRASPGDFRLDAHDRLVHKPSYHAFYVEDRQVKVYAPCECSSYLTRSHQVAEFERAVDQWRASYWDVQRLTPSHQRLQTRINEEFARHFKARPVKVVGRAAKIFASWSPALASGAAAIAIGLTAWLSN